MKRELGAGFLAAVVLHALVLFGLRLETPAHPLALSDEPSTVDVSLVAAPPEPAAAAPTPAEPPATPAPVPTPVPIPTPEPRPTPDMATPPPVAEPTPDEDAIPAPKSTPVPERPKPMPRRTAQRAAKPATPHSAAGSAAALGGAGAASRGAASGRPGTHARYLSNPKPDYPAEARRERQEGVVLVSVEVGADGRAGEVSLGRSSGFALLDAAAVEAVRRWSFAPAEEAGVPVSSRVEVPVRFSLAR
jgi:protein TonB